MTGSEAVILARSAEGAQAAARLVDGDALSIVDPELTEVSRDRLLLDRTSVIVVECDSAFPEWVLHALSVCRDAIGPGDSLRLVLRPGRTRPENEEAFARALAGWAVVSVHADGELVSVSVSPTSEDADPVRTLDSIRGALVLAQMLNTVADPTSEDLPEFEYQASLMTSYLREIPRLHAETERLAQELTTLSASGKNLDEAWRAKNPNKPKTPFGQPVQSAQTSKPYQATQAAGDKRRGSKPQTSQRKKPLLVAGAAVVSVLASLAIALVTNGGPEAFLISLVLFAVLGSALDTRRRAMRLQSAVRQSANENHRQTVSLMRELSRDLTREVKTTEVQTTATLNDFTEAVRDLSKSVETAGAMSREVGSVLDSLTSTLSVRHGELLKAVPRTWDIRALLRAELLTNYRQLEANFQLRDLVAVSGGTPQLRGWAASPDVIVFLINELSRARPRLVVECGSGASTVWLAMAVRSAGIDTRIVALEHDPIFASETSRLLRECKVDDVAEVRLAPLERVSLKGFDGEWYSPAALEDLDEIGLVFVDGPPGNTNPLARYPAVPLLRELLSDDAVIVLDDVIREEETMVQERWTSEFPEFSVESHKFEKGAAVFRLGSEV